MVTLLEVQVTRGLASGRLGIGVAPVLAGGRVTHLVDSGVAGLAGAGLHGSP